MLSVVIEAFKRSVMFLSVHLSQIVVWYTATGLYITLHSSSARLDGIHPVHIHLIGMLTAVSSIERLRLYEFTLWCRDLVSVVRITFSNLEALVSWEWIELHLRKLLQIFSAGEFFEISYMGFDTVSTYRRFRGKIFAETNKGTPWALGLEKCIIRKARFWKSSSLFKCDYGAWPQTTRPYDK